MSELQLQGEVQQQEGVSLKPAQVQAWLQEIDSRREKEKDWRKDAAKIIEIYEGYNRETCPFNILYSNTDTLAPALYNNTPRPAVGKRYKDTDPLAAAVALTMNRTLSYTMDNNCGADTPFDELVKGTIISALVPGRGVVRWKYVAEYDEGVEQPDTVEVIKNPSIEGDAIQEDESAEEDSIPPQIHGEKVVGESVAYDRIIFGYYTKWSELPWLAFEHHMTEDELIENFGFELGSKVKVAKLDTEGCTPQQQKQQDTRKIALVYELWDKNSKKVYFLTPGNTTIVLKEAQDPLNLTGFFPCEEPLHFMHKLSSTVPQPLFNLYREQADELNMITRRITAIINALKVRGAFDSTCPEFSKIFESDDCVLVPLDNVAFSETALKDKIFLMPLSELINVLQQLYVQREQIKQVIYEITGISDIIRGSSVASESATAQKIKNQWGTLRLKEMQKRVTVWCVNNLRIIAEMSASKFSIDTFKMMTGLPYVDEAAKQQAQIAVQQAQQQGKPAPQEAQDIMATPTWEAVVGMLRNTLMREYRVDIETNSTIADDLEEDQKNTGELLNALSQFLNGVAPLIENGSMPFEVAKSMMLGVVRKMAMGPEVEQYLEKMTAPKPPEEKAPPVDPNIQAKQQVEAQKAQLELQKLQMEGEMMKQQQAMELQKLQTEQQTLQLEMEKMQLEMQLLREEAKNKLAVEGQKAQVNQEKFMTQMALQKSKASQVTGGSNADI